MGRLLCCFGIHHWFYDTLAVHPRVVHRWCIRCGHDQWWNWRGWWVNYYYKLNEDKK